MRRDGGAKSRLLGEYKPSNNVGKPLLIPADGGGSTSNGDSLARCITASRGRWRGIDNAVWIMRRALRLEECLANLGNEEVGRLFSG